MPMVSLKNASDESAVEAMPRENYGYGLRLCLNHEQCEALGITKALAAGTQVTITAKGLVCRSSEAVEDDGDDAGPDITLDVQITDMELTPGSVRKDAAVVLYGG